MLGFFPQDVLAALLAPVSAAWTLPATRLATIIRAKQIPRSTL
jgi:hypothetical protein